MPFLSSGLGTAAQAAQAAHYCPQCGAANACAVAAQQAAHICWCMQLPPLPVSVPQLQPKADGNLHPQSALRCLCPRCAQALQSVY
ncbi:MAG: cysteine-rich CWC family protein [Comamonas sp.]|nr:cysteine-rich CWC family protein [Comamonas sp.]